MGSGQLSMCCIVLYCIVLYALYITFYIWGLNCFHRKKANNLVLGIEDVIVVLGLVILPQNRLFRQTIIPSFVSLCVIDAVTYGHIVNSCPYKNTVDVVELKGKHLLQVFEQVASLYDENKPRGSFLQVSGIFLISSSFFFSYRMHAVQMLWSLKATANEEPMFRKQMFRRLRPQETSVAEDSLPGKQKCS